MVMFCGHFWCFGPPSLQEITDLCNDGILSPCLVGWLGGGRRGSVRESWREGEGEGEGEGEWEWEWEWGQG